MIGLLVMLFCMYRFIFSDWSLSKDEWAVFVLAVLIELIIEWLVGCGIYKACKEDKP